jgi:hypothetical protein
LDGHNSFIHLEFVEAVHICLEGLGFRHEGSTIHMPGVRVDAIGVLEDDTDSAGWLFQKEGVAISFCSGDSSPPLVEVGLDEMR